MVILTKRRLRVPIHHVIACIMYIFVQLLQIALGLDNHVWTVMQLRMILTLWYLFSIELLHVYMYKASESELIIYIMNTFESTCKFPNYYKTYICDIWRRQKKERHPSVQIIIYGLMNANQLHIFTFHLKQSSCCSLV